MLEQIKKESCKEVTTIDALGKENGFLIELYKDGPKTTLYLTAAYPKAFKGYHLHKVRFSHYVCIKGKMKITVYEDPEQVRWVKKVEHVLSAQNPERLFLPTNVYIGLENVGDGEAWLINFPQPSYDPELIDEQMDLSPEELESKAKR